MSVDLERHEPSASQFGHRHGSSVVTAKASSIPRTPKREFYPVSLAQRRLWFLNELMPGNAFYNMPAAMRLRGALDIGVLRAAINQIVARHDSLRATFINVGGEPAQVIAPQLSLELELIDLSELASHEQQPALQRHVERAAKAPFDLSQGPLLRTKLLRLSDLEHVLVVTMHHIVSDGWSLGVFVRDLAASYSAAKAELPGSLPELPVRYVDFAAWQQTAITREEQERQLAYWSEKLGNAPPVLDLATDLRRPPVPSFRGRKKHFRVGAETTKQLRELAKGERATLFMVLASAFNLLLHRYTDQDDILVGLPIAGRNQLELEPLIGFFANTLVLRTDLSGNPSFRELLRRVRVATMEALEHQDTPFERVVDVLKIERNMSYTPLFQVCLALQPKLPAALQIGDLEVEPYDVDAGTAKFDLWLSFIESNVGLQGTVEYATDLFCDVTIDRLVERLCRVLTRIVTDPDSSIGSLPLLSEGEHRQLLASASESLQSASSPVCLHRWFERVVTQFPERSAISCAEKSLTYDQLNRRANRLARHLLRAGVASGDLIGLYAHRSIDLVVAVLAILKAGAAYLPLDPSYPRQRLAYMLDDAQSPVLVLVDAGGDNPPEFAGKVVNLARGEELESIDDTNLDRPVDPDAPAYVIYTSGSTGRPKGCVVTHRNVSRLFTETEHWYHFSHDDVWTFFHSHAFDFSVWEIWGALLYGGRLVVVPYLISRTPEQFHDLLISEGVTVLNQTPSAFQQLLRVEERSVRRIEQLRYVIFGGEALEFESLRPWLERYGDRRPTLINMYGITETTVHVTFRTITIHDLERRVGSVIGVPIPDLRVFILDQQLKPVPIGVPGEMFVEGAGLAVGYLRRPELTTERFISSQLLGRPRRLYRTGDKARYLYNGELEYLGRVDTQVKIRGFRIELGEIESELLRHPDVAEARVLVRDSTGVGRQLVGYVVPASMAPGDASTSGTSLEAEQTREWESVFDTTYFQGHGACDPVLNITGWKSSYNGALLSEVEMLEWVERTVERIRSFEPRRVLEIGVGTGMLLLRLAPHCESYTGTDFSVEALKCVNATLAKLETPLNSVQLLQQEAIAFESIPASAFDTVIINSVAQYFPSTDYLESVISGAMEALAPGGRVFLGDIRNLDLMRAFQCSVELHAASDTMTCAELVRRVGRNMTLDTELVLSPAFFLALQRRVGALKSVEIRYKRALHHNEMSCFRFDVFLHKTGTETPAAPELQLEFDSEWEIESVERMLRQNEPRSVLLRNVPNARVAPAIAALDRADECPSLAVRELKQIVKSKSGATFDPECFWSLGERTQYQVEVIASSSGSERCFDVVFKRSCGPVFCAAGQFDGMRRELGSYASKPLLSKVRARLMSELRAQLRKALPDYMVPNGFVFVDHFPLTPNGKVDVNALPTPALDREDLGARYVAPDSALELQLASLWRQVLGIASVGVNDNFFELGGHSLLATQLFFRVNEALGIKLPLQSLFSSPTIGGMAAAIESLGREPSTKVSIEQRNELELDTHLDDSVRPNGQAIAAQDGPTLLTGATGFLGAFLLAKLIEHRRKAIFCLVRREDGRDGIARLQSNLRRFGLERYWNEGRVIAVPGDLARPLFGLGTRQFDALAGEASLVIHNGAMVNFVYPYSALRAPNVQGTQEVLRFATTGRLKPIHFISSLHVFASHSIEGPLIVDEEMTPCLDSPPQLGYTQSKLVCELMLVEARRRGVPVAVYRPGRIGGDSQTGNSQHADFLWRFLKGCVQLGYYPEVEFPVDLVPADYLAEAILRIAFTRPPSTSNRDVYHFSSSRPLAFGAAISAMQSKGFVLEPLSYADWISLLLRRSPSEQENALYSLLPLFAQGGQALQPPSVIFEQSHTSALLNELGCPIPPTDCQLFERYVDYMIRAKFFPLPN